MSETFYPANKHYDCETQCVFLFPLLDYKSFILNTTPTVQLKALNTLIVMLLASPRRHQAKPRSGDRLSDARRRMLPGALIVA